MNVAIIKAGGSGKRVGRDIPKQFLTINDKPLIVYTLEMFDSAPGVDHIIIPTIKGWEDVIEAYIKDYKISTPTTVITGGETNIGSVLKCVPIIERLKLSDDDVVLMQDGTRPLITHDIINNLVLTAKEKGNAFASIPCYNLALVSEDGKASLEFLHRDKIFFPQSDGITFGEFKKALKALAEESSSAMSINDVLIHQKTPLNIIQGSELNFKVTSPADFEIMSLLLKNRGSKNE